MDYFYIPQLNEPLAQLVEHHTFNVRVRESCSLRFTQRFLLAFLLKIKTNFQNGLVAQVVRAEHS